MIGSHIDIAERVRRRGEWYLKSEEFLSAIAEGCFIIRYYPCGEHFLDLWWVAAMSATYDGCLAQLEENRMDILWQVCRNEEDFPVGLNEKQTEALARWTEEQARANQAPAIDLTVDEEMFYAIGIPLWQIGWIPASDVVSFITQYLKTVRERAERGRRDEEMRIRESEEARILGHGL